MTETRPDKSLTFSNPQWQSNVGYRCEVRLVPEDVGFSVYVPQLAGCHSQGDTEEEALLNIKDALSLCIAAYKPGSIPWREAIAKKPNEISRWIVAQ